MASKYEDLANKLLKMIDEDQDLDYDNCLLALKYFLIKEAYYRDRNGITHTSALVLLNDRVFLLNYSIQLDEFGENELVFHESIQEIHESILALTDIYIK